MEALLAGARAPQRPAAPLDKLSAAPKRVAAHSRDDACVRPHTLEDFEGSLDFATAGLLRGASDVFLLSRVNDTTSYFSAWCLARQQRRRQDVSCAICLDLLSDPVELSCSHAFCSGCLGQAAQRGHDACPLCRRKQTLDPRRLRADLAAARSKYQLWRQGIRVSRVRSRQQEKQHESVTAGVNRLRALWRTSQAFKAMAEPEPVGCAPQEDLAARWRAAKAAQPAATGCSPLLALSTRWQAAKSSSSSVGGSSDLAARWAAASAVDESVGSSSDLAARWASASAVDESVGSSSDLAARWAAASAVDESVGSSSDLAARWNAAKTMDSSVGSSSDLAARWNAAKAADSSVGAVTDLATRWNTAKAVDSSVGSSADLATRWNAAKAVDSSVGSSADLATRWNAAKAADSSVGAVTDLSTRWNAAKAADSSVGSSADLATRWSAAKAFGSVGSVPQDELAARWVAAQC